MRKAGLYQGGVNNSEEEGEDVVGSSEECRAGYSLDWYRHRCFLINRYLCVSSITNLVCI